MIQNNKKDNNNDRESNTTITQCYNYYVATAHFHLRGSSVSTITRDCLDSMILEEVPVVKSRWD